MAVRDSSRISPTAHYTGYIWCRHGMSHPALETRTGKVIFRVLEPIMVASRVLGGPVIEDVLLARHRCIDYLLTRAIDSGTVGQIIEIGAGLSPRGIHMVRRFQHQELRYVEGDLPDMAREKRERFASMDLLRPGHHVVDMDALEIDGTRSLEAVAERYLDPEVGTAIITEGLINYFDAETVSRLWQRIASLLHRYPSGVYLSDMYLDQDIDEIPGARAFRIALAALTRGRVDVHFGEALQSENAFRDAGFARATTWSMPDLAEQVGLEMAQTQAPVRVSEAWIAHVRS